MKAIIEIDMDNAAFEQNGNGAELSDILKHTAARIDGDILSAGDTVLIRDSNGNSVGKLSIKN